MDCRFCKVGLVSGIEVKTGACAGCVGRELAAAEQTNERVPLLEDKVRELETKILKYYKATEQAAAIHSAQKSGGEAHARGASLDDNPFDPDDDTAASWSYGWLQADMASHVGKAQAVMTWTLIQLSVIREVALGGASGDEVAAKVADIVAKIEPYVSY